MKNWQIYFKKYGISMVVAWSCMLIGLVSYILHDHHRHTIEEASREARDYYRLNVQYRKWNAMLGGVYAAADKVVSNPHLTMPERDVLTVSGKKLTLINPAYMTRMVFEEIQKESGLPIMSKLVSLKPLNPKNAANDWERETLLLFEQKGLQERYQVVMVDGETYLQFMSAFTTEESCLKCHAHQGYKLGDVRGGMRIAIPLRNYLASEKETSRSMLGGFGMLWLVGSIGIAGYSRKRYQQEVKLEDEKTRAVELAEKYALVTNGIPYLIAQVGRDERYLFANKGYAEWAGLGAEQIVGQTVREVVGELVYGLSEGYIRQALQGIPCHFERHVTKDGQIMEQSLDFVPQNNEQGETVSYFALIHDMTDIKHAEKELQKLHQAVEQSPVSVLITDTAGIIEYVNPKLVQMTGYRPEELYGQTPRIFQGDTPAEVFADLWRTIRSGATWEGNIHNRKKTGELFWERATIAPIRNKAGEITHYLAVKDDITKQLQIEEQLRHAQRLDSIGQLAGGIAHDFNNVLTVIGGYASLVEGQLDKAQLDTSMVKEVSAAVERATSLTRGLLAFSRKKQMETRAHDLNLVISGVRKMLDRLITEDITLTTNLFEHPLSVRIDLGEIEQVLINLVTNARDAMPKGGTIAISTSQQTIDLDYVAAHGYGTPGTYALIAVSDTGTGMDKATCSRIFDPFFTTKEVGRGTGLGLAIAYGIFKQHNGLINVYSEPGVGTTFKAYLPLIMDTAVLPPVEDSINSPLSGTETILVVEDDYHIRDLMAKILTSTGYSVILAVDGEDAMEKYKEYRHSIQLVITDIIMPKKNGAEVYNEIRQLNANTKVIFTSGYTNDILQSRGGIQAGVELLLKPVLPKLLLQKVREHLDADK